MLFVELALIRWTAANNIHLAYLTRRTHPRIRPGCVNPSGMLHAAAILSPSLELPQVVLAAFVARFELRSARRRAYEPRRRRGAALTRPLMRLFLAFVQASPRVTGRSP
jgi:hypothetical protein